MNRRLLWILVLALGVAVLWIFSDRPVSSQSSSSKVVGDKTQQPAPAAPAGLPTQLESKQVGTATVRSPTPDEQQIADKLLFAFKNPQPFDATAIAPRRAPIPNNLVPKAPTLSEAQRRALQKLRWGPTKELDYHGDGEDATVRSLSAPALAEALDPANPNGEAPGEKVRRFVANNRELFLLKNPDDEMVVTVVESDSRGGSVVRLGQRFAGLEVWPGQLTANINGAGYLTVVTGAYSPTPDAIDLISRFTPEAALESARLHLGIETARLQQPPAAPTLKIFADKGRIPELAYDVAIQSPGKAERVFVSAITGSVLLSFSEICHASATTTATDMFGQSRSINVQSSGSPIRYYLRDTTKPMWSAATNKGAIVIYDGSTTPNPVSSSASLTSGFDSVAVSAAYNLGKVYDFYNSAFGRNSFDGKGGSIVAYVRYPENNAAWYSSGYMTLGTGDAYAGASDVVGHEFTHAVVQHSAKLIYNGDSGALNEGFADIMGEGFERFLNGSNDWVLGTRLSASIRNMKAPQTKGQPSTMSQYVRTTDDNGGVHANSGIINHAFYILAEGLQSGGIGFDNARNIYYRALNTKLNSRSGFQDLRIACLLSSTELFGAGSVQSTKTGQAFDYVEIFDAGVLGVPENLTPPVGPDSYLITSLAGDGNFYLWRNEAAMGDGASLRAISTIPIDPNSRASVSADGSAAVFVAANRDVVFASTNGSDQAALGHPGLFNSATISKDGKILALIARDPATGIPKNEMALLNLSTNQLEVINLYLPVMDGGTTTRITRVDEVDLSPDGQIALFDGLASTTLADGTTLNAWSVFSVNLKTKAVVSIAGPWEGLNIGNPAFARTSDQRIIFEAATSTSDFVVGVDLLKETWVTVRAFTPPNNYFAFPRFSAADDFVVFAEDYWSLSTLSYQPRVSRIGLSLLDRITPVGSSLVLRSMAYNGLSYRRGAFAGAPTLAVTALNSTLQAGQSGKFRIERKSGDQAIRVPLSFKLLGTAKPAVDYAALPSAALIPANESFVDVTVQTLASAGGPSRVLTVSLDPQSHYLIGSTNADASMTILANIAPTISAQPVSQTVVSGQNVSFTVVATGTPAPTYQWRKAGTAISGATNASYTIAGVSVATAGSYAVVVTNAAGSVTSSAATLTVIDPPVITTAPASQGVQAGQNATFSVTASGTGPLSYQWFRDGVPVGGATAASFTIGAVQVTDGGAYTVAVSNWATRVQAAAGGVYHSSFLQGGALWATGDNGVGALGDGTTTNRSTPVQVASGVAGVAAGGYHALFMRTDGTLWATGYNSFGQLGDGTTTNRSAPMQVASGVASVAAGGRHTLFMRTDGTLWATGYNSFGQLGDGTTTNRSSPVQVSSGVASVAAGVYHTLFVKTDGTLWGIGDNVNGQLGDGTTTNRSTPVQVASEVANVAAGGGHTLFVKTDGTLWAMGLNSVGALGDGTTTNRSTPVPVASGVASAAAAGNNSLFVKTDGTLWATGYNDRGQLGDGTTTARSTPLKVASGVASVAVGFNQTLIVTTDGKLWATGNNDRGQLGDGTTTSRSVPVMIRGGVFSSAAVLTVASSVAPAITTQPQSQTVAVGQNVSFTVVATGTPVPTFQWRKGGVAISGATNATYTIAGVQTTAAGSYDVLVTNAAGSAPSSAATLTVNVAPAITTQPQSQTVAAGGNATFTVVATGTPVPTFQWRKGGVAISGATNATYTIAGVQTTAAGSYDVLLTNAVGSATSSAATLTVNTVPAITTQPQSQTVASGQNAAFTVVATGTPALAFQWRKGGTAISGATNATYTITGVPTTAAGSYDVVVTNTAGSVTSSAATLTVNTGPAFTTQPQSQSATTAGGSVTFSAAATGNPAPSYQWFHSLVAIAGATNATLTLTNVQASAAGYYWVVATNTWGSATSWFATFEIKLPNNTATHTLVGSGYLAGQPLTITNTLTYAGTASSVSWSVLLPDEWSFISSAGSTASSVPVAGQTGILQWEWTSVPASPISFTYTVAVPPGATGPQLLVALVGVENGTSMKFLAQPDPLPVPQVPIHSGDTNRDYRISLLELTRVIELYNTRHGTTRTGAYRAQTGTEDGFATEARRGEAASVTLDAYHSADTSRDGKLGLTELLRVIELYNTRTGALRTGRYLVQSSTEDGFAPNP